MDRATLLSTCGGLGRLSPGAGTWASVVAVILGTALAHFVSLYALLAALCLLGVLTALWLPGYLSRHAEKDPSEVVVDEFLGAWLGLLLVFYAAPPRVSPVIGAVLLFLLFRVFDIGKPLVIARLEKLPGAKGVVADDLAAGFAAALVTLVLIWGVVLAV